MNRVKNETNPTAYKRQRRKVLAKKTGMCAYCGPNQGENRTGYGHGKTKPKYKEHRK